MLQGVRRNLRHHGLLAAAHWAVGGLAEELAHEGIRRRSRPSVAELAALDGTLATSAAEVLRHLRTRPDQPSLELLRDESEQALSALHERYSSCRLLYPENFAVEQETSFLLYAAVRLLRPGVVLETGVANGHSTHLILSALRRNGVGRLFSYDVSTDVGALVSEELRERWQLFVGDLSHPEDGLDELLAQTGPVDLAFLDADHSYHGQLFEYTRTLDALTEHGLLISDDVDYSRAFIDVASRSRHRPTLLFDGRKVVGVLSVGSERHDGVDRRTTVGATAGAV